MVGSMRDLHHSFKLLKNKYNLLLILKTTTTMSNDSTFVGGRASYCSMQIISLFIVVSKCRCQKNVRSMTINIMKRLTVHGTGFKLLLHISIFTGSGFRPSPELISIGNSIICSDI